MLSWEDAQKQYDVLFISGVTDVLPNNQLAVNIDNLYQAGQIKLYECWNECKHLPLGEFMDVFNIAFLSILSNDELISIKSL